MDVDTHGGKAMGFGLDTFGSLKMQYCCDFSEEEALEKMETR